MRIILHACICHDKSAEEFETVEDIIERDDTWELFEEDAGKQLMHSFAIGNMLSLIDGAIEKIFIDRTLQSETLHRRVDAPIQFTGTRSEVTCERLKRSIVFRREKTQTNSV